MVVDTDISIALKEENGYYRVKNFNIFNITNINNDFYFRKNNKSKDVVFRIMCPLCGEYHCYKYNIFIFIKKEMLFGGCEKVGIPIFFIGKRTIVEEKVNEYIQKNKKLHDMI